MELLKKQTLSGKIIGLIVLAILVVSGTIFGSTYLFIYRNIADQAKNNLLTNGNLVDAQIDFLKARLAMVASLMANNADVVVAVKNKNRDFLRQYSQDIMKVANGIFITIADNEGNAIARGHSLQAGDNVSNQTNIKKALAGTASSGIEEGTVVKFSLRAGHPVKIGDQIIGSITAGIDLSGNHSFVDEMKKKLGVEVTLFHNDTRATTSIIKDGQRAIGTKMDNPRVLDAVLQKGEKFHGINKILGKDHDTLYWPLMGANGKTLGMYFVGKDHKPVQEALIKIIFSILVPIIVIGTLMVIFSFYVTRSMTKPITLSIDFAKKMSEGDLSQTLDIQRKDEIGILAGALNQMASNLREMFQKTSNGVQALSASSTELSAISEQMASGANDQAGRSHQVATASEEMSQTIMDAAKNTSVIANSVTETTKIAKEGEEIVNKSVQEVRKIASTVSESAKLLTLLGERSKQISEIVNVINDIADQTNLLALNAAIEAARAGEQGRGFAVVADEVRKLAERTATSTSEISDMITSIQEEVDRTIQSMEYATKKVDTGVDLTNHAGDAFSSIVKRVDDLNTMVQQIASATEEMASTSEEISRDIESIAQVSRETSSNAGQTSRTSAELARLSKDLREIISSFRV